jgi:hypothetical protein
VDKVSLATFHYQHRGGSRSCFLDENKNGWTEVMERAHLLWHCHIVGSSARQSTFLGSLDASC